MTVSIEKVYEDVKELRAEVRRLSKIVEEDFELSDSAKEKLAEARNEPLEIYIDHDKVAKEFS